MLIRKYLYERLRKKIHIPHQQDSSTFIPRVSKQCIFNIDRQQDRSTEVSKTGKYKAPIN